MATLKKYGDVEIAPYANLRGTNLGGASLHGANLRGTNLRGANLRGADLGGTNLRGANLRGADLRGADLYGADLRGANLRGADLYGADLGGADLRGTNLHGANLHGADLGEGNWVVCGPSRSDGYAFFYMKLKGDKAARVVAGCRDMPMNKARQHWQATPRADTSLGVETFAILDCLEALAKARGLV